MPTAPYNETHWQNDQWLAIVEEAMKTGDETKRNELIAQAQTIEYERGRLHRLGLQQPDRRLQLQARRRRARQVRRAALELPLQQLLLRLSRLACSEDTSPPLAAPAAGRRAPGSDPTRRRDRCATAAQTDPHPPRPRAPHPVPGLARGLRRHPGACPATRPRRSWARKPPTRRAMRPCASSSISTGPSTRSTSAGSAASSRATSGSVDRPAGHRRSRTCSSRPRPQLRHPRRSSPRSSASRSRSSSAPLTAVWRDSKFDTSVNLVNLGLAALPEFVIGHHPRAALRHGRLQLAAGGLPHRPRRPGRAPSSISSSCRRITLCLAVIPYVSRMLRASTIEVLESEYVMMARLKGLSGQHRALASRAAQRHRADPPGDRHATSPGWPAASSPSSTSSASPGIGYALVDAVANRDIPMVQALCLLIAAVYVVLNLIADVAHDPHQPPPADRPAMSDEPSSQRRLTRPRLLDAPAPIAAAARGPVSRASSPSCCTTPGA